MKTMESRSCVADPNEVVFKTSPLVMFLPTGVLTAVIALLTLGLVNEVLDGFYWFVIVVLLPLTLVFLVRGFLPTLGKDNWVLRVNDSGLSVLLRNYRIHQGIDGVDDVLAIEHSEVLCVRQLTRYGEAPGAEVGETMRWRENYLVIELNEAVIDEATDAIAFVEQSLSKAAASVRTPMVSSNASIDGGSLKLLWNGRFENIRPSLGAALDTFQKRGISVADPIEERTNSGEIDDGTLDQQVGQLLRSGERMTAMKILRERRGLSLKEAMQHLERLPVPERLRQS